MLPALEKALSDGTEVADMHRYFLAYFESLGYLFSLFFHHCNGHIFLGIMASEVYISISSDEARISSGNSISRAHFFEGFSST